MTKNEVINKIDEINRQMNEVEDKLKSNKKEYILQKNKAKENLRQIKEKIIDKKSSIFRSIVVGCASLFFGFSSLMLILFGGLSASSINFAKFVGSGFLAVCSISAIVSAIMATKDIKAKNELEKNKIIAEDALDLAENAETKVEAENNNAILNELAREKAKYLKALEAFDEIEKKEKSVKKDNTKKLLTKTVAKKDLEDSSLDSNEKLF
ncbi:MAG: hypothetical protein ACI4TI_03575 [Christensenellales bacterium]